MLRRVQRSSVSSPELAIRSLFPAVDYRWPFSIKNFISLCCLLASSLSSFYKLDKLFIWQQWPDTMLNVPQSHPGHIRYLGSLYYIIFVWRLNPINQWMCLVSIIQNHTKKSVYRLLATFLLLWNWFLLNRLLYFPFIFVFFLRCADHLLTHGEKQNH